MRTTNFREANRRYLRVFVPVMILYCLLCFGGPMLFLDMENPPKLFVAALAILTGAPICVVFWLMGRHLKETDEYTRKIQVDAILVGGGITLSVAVVWAFLELYRVVPQVAHFPSMMMVGPLFFGAWGLAYAVQSFKRR